MKALVITCYESNEERAKLIVEALSEKDYEVNAITSNFSHFRKEYRKEIPEGFIAIPTFKYRKNMSIARLNSHAQFASDAYILAKEYKPDLLWIIAPCNSLIKTARKYKKKYPNTKVIVDIIDMWPESLPSKLKDLFVMKLWRNIRTKNIKYVDHVVCECDMYQDILRKEFSKDITTIHWARENNLKLKELDLPKDKIGLVYIGSINNIIDVNEICRVIKSIDKPVILHIIGDGENKENMIEQTSKVCEVMYHGKIYDEEKKEEIFAQCHAGLNIYKQGLYIGLTVKSIDYFEHKLPIINNIKGDTYNLIEKYNAGVNFDGSKIDSLKLIELRNKDIKVFEENFTKDIFMKKINEVISK